MATATFEYRYFIAAPAARIYAHLADPNSYIGLSPLVVSVRDIAYSQDEAARQVCRYVSVERFRFLGFIPYDNHIRVTTTFTQPDVQMVSAVDSPFNVQIRFVFDLSPERDGTWVQETVSAEMPGLLRGFVVSQAQSVQRARAQILRTRMEAQPG